MHTIAIDACLIGVGGVWGNQVCTAKLSNDWASDRAHHINHFEMVATRLWGEKWQHKHVKVYVDNASVVQVYNNGYTHDSFLVSCIRNIWLYTPIWDISLQVQHIAGYHIRDLGDLLSRWQNHQTCND